MLPPQNSDASSSIHRQTPLDLPADIHSISTPDGSNRRKPRRRPLEFRLPHFALDDGNFLKPFIKKKLMMIYGR
jgi:hypothetical protein